MRIFEGGRTETIRSCSLESLEFVQAMTCDKVDNENRLELMKKAVNAHGQYTQMALEGGGVDRHLLGLKLMAIENNMPIPCFFKSPGFTKSTHFRVATSQVASKDAAFMCYGPSTRDGYSCCYNPRSDDMFFAVGAWISNKETCAKRFSASLDQALTNMQIIVQSGKSDNVKCKL